MKALFRIKIGKGKYLAIFWNSLIIEYYNDEDTMYGMHCII